MHGDLEFAVLDVETTGFSPRLHDRILEVGIVRVDAACNVIREYCTLINPNRDVGPTHVHGISAADVREAPLFEEVVGDIQDAIRGTILVAHNATFDLRFLVYQCNACKVPLPPIDYLCTLQLAKVVGVDVPSRKLGVLCEAFGIPRGQAHSALDDARATTMLLAKLLQKTESYSVPATLSALGMKTVPSTSTSWAKTIPSGKEYRRSNATARKQNAGGWLSRLFISLPAQNSTHNSADEYLVVLEHALEDRMISDAEIAALGEVATSLDMDQSEVQEAHISFLQDVIRAAWLDKIITEEEKRDIDLVAKLLGVSEKDYHGMIAFVKAEDVPMASRTHASRMEFEGQEVCFTGSFSSLQNSERVTRDMMEALAAEHGMIVKKGVTKSLNILVCADPNTMSNKGRKAREYGVRIIAEPAFFKMLGI